MKFIDRFNELRLLNNVIHQKEGGFVVLYGRRRIGKTRLLLEWVKNEDKMIIAGHTHRPVFPLPQEAPSFNDGSCVHPRCITCIEFNEGYVSLVKWQQQTRADGTLFVGRETLEGPRDLALYLRHRPIVFQPPNSVASEQQSLLKIHFSA